MENADVQDEINFLLKYIPLSLVGDAFFDVDELEQFVLVPISGVNLPFKWSASVEYEVLYNNNEVISIVYYGECSDSSKVWVEKSYATIEINTGKLTTLENTYDRDLLLASINDGVYDVIDGTYMPDGWDPHDPSIRALFLDALEKELSLETNDTMYNRHSCQNYGIDADNIYIKFLFSDSLRGYVVLRIPI